MIHRAENVMLIFVYIIERARAIAAFIMSISVTAVEANNRDGTPANLQKALIIGALSKRRRQN